jgi:hypothetical protein
VDTADADRGSAAPEALASPPQVRWLRQWMREEVAEQVRRGRAPRSYDDFLAGSACASSLTA